MPAAQGEIARDDVGVQGADILQGDVARDPVKCDGTQVMHGQVAGDRPKGDRSVQGLQAGVSGDIDDVQAGAAWQIEDEIFVAQDRDRIGRSPSVLTMISERSQPATRRSPVTLSTSTLGVALTVKVCCCMVYSSPFKMRMASSADILPESRSSRTTRRFSSGISVASSFPGS